MAALDTIADRQSGWSLTANKLEAGIDRSRWAVFVFSVLGAFGLFFLDEDWSFSPPGDKRKSKPPKEDDRQIVDAGSARDVYVEAPPGSEIAIRRAFAALGESVWPRRVARPRTVARGEDRRRPGTCVKPAQCREGPAPYVALAWRGGRVRRHALPPDGSLWQDGAADRGRRRLLAIQTAARAGAPRRDLPAGQRGPSRRDHRQRSSREAGDHP